MASELGLLIPDFRKQLLKGLAAAKEQKLNIDVLTTIVTPQEQAALWKQGRTKVDAELKVMALENAKAPFLADCLRNAIPQATNQVTDLLPGMSWANWGEAVMVIWVDGSLKINWSSKSMLGGFNGYKKFAGIAQSFFLHCGGEWMETDIAWRYIQLRPERTPSEVYSLEQIDAEMKKRYHK